MDILPPWASALKVSLTHIQKWMQQGAPAGELLEWCLDHGKIKEQDYLAWAKDYYHLPVLKIDFFEQAVPETLFKQKQSDAWRDSLFPVAQWDGVVFVGCLEPSATPPMKEPVQYLLVPRSLQKIWWQALNKPAATVNDLPMLAPEKPTTKKIEKTSVAKTEKKVEAVKKKEVPTSFSTSSSDDEFELAFELEDSHVDVPVVEKVTKPQPAVEKISVQPKVEKILLPPVVEAPKVLVPPPAPVMTMTPNATAIVTQTPATVTPAAAPVEEAPLGLNFNIEDTSNKSEKTKEFSFDDFLKEEEPKKEDAEANNSEDTETEAPAGLSFDSFTETKTSVPTSTTTNSEFKLSLSIATEPQGATPVPTPPPAPLATPSPSPTLSLVPTGPAVSTPPSAPAQAPTPPPAPAMTIAPQAASPVQMPTPPMASPPVTTAPPPPPVLGISKTPTPPPAPAIAPTPPVSAMPPPMMATPSPVVVAPPPPMVATPPPVPMAPPVLTVVPPPMATPPTMSATPPPPPMMGPAKTIAPPPAPTMAPPSMMPPPMTSTPPPMPSAVSQVPKVETQTAPANSRMGSLSQPVYDSFQKMREHFEQCMVLTYKNEKLVPSQWDDTWTLTNNLPPSIDLEGPSIFKIVLDTKGPYHGYVTPSPTNDAFFGSWNQGRYPEHVTLVPLLLGNEVVGMLYGSSSRVRGSMATLSNYQTMGLDLAQKIAS